MLSKTRNMLVRLHKDESGPNTVEWVLLIIVGLVVLIGIFAIAQFVINRMNTAQTDMAGEQGQLGGLTGQTQRN